MSITSGMKLGMSRAIGLVVILVLGSASGVLAAGQPTRYLVKDTGHGFAGLPSSIQPIFWLDDNRILYTGWDPNIKEIRKDDGQSVTKVGIYVFDLIANTATRHTDAQGFLCYRDGFVRYLVTYDAKTRIAVMREGRFGEEKEIVSDMNQRAAGYIVNPLTCTDYDARGHATERGKRMPLLDGHGVLEYSRVVSRAPGSPMHPARLYRDDGKEPITLAVNGAAISESRVRYYEFANIYTVGYLPPEGLSTKWPKNAVHRVFLMNPEGDVTEVPLSGGAWSGVPISWFVLTRAGIVLYGGGLRSDTDPGTAGIYLVHDGRSVKLASGLLRGIGVSPNGCGLALGMRTYGRRSSPTTLRIVDVCGEEGRK